MNLIKTYKQDFFDKFPHAERNAPGTDIEFPVICRKRFYGYCECRGNCAECWNERMKENK